MDKKQIKSLIESFETLGWSDEEKEQAVRTILQNPGKQTVVMPKHYETEAHMHAKNTCQYSLGLSESDPKYKSAYKKAFKEYLMDAYKNSTGIDLDDVDFAQNPTTPRARAAFVAVLTREDSPFTKIVKRLSSTGIMNDLAAANKFQSVLKSGTMTLTNLYMRYVGKLETRAPDNTEYGFKGQPTDFQFVKKYSELNKEGKERFVREVGVNNLCRGIIATTVLHAIEHVFAVDFTKLRQNLVRATNSLPNSTFTDSGWRAEFFQSLSYVVRKRLAQINLEELISDVFENTRPKHVGNIIVGTNLDDIARGSVESEMFEAAESWKPGLDLGVRAMKEAQAGVKIGLDKMQPLKIEYKTPEVKNEENKISQTEAKEIIEMVAANAESKKRKGKKKDEPQPINDIFSYSRQNPCKKGGKEKLKTVLRFDF